MRNKTKRIILVIIVICFSLLLLTSCSSSTADTTQPLNSFREEKGILKPLVYVIALFMHWVSTWFSSGAFAWAILITTIVLRTLAWPIYAKTNDMSVKMAVAQPEMERLQAKYANRKDPQSQQRMQQEMMAIYKKHKISIFGCLMPFLQMPLFLAMYSVVTRAPLAPVYSDLGLIVTTTDAATAEVYNFNETETNKYTIQLSDGSYLELASYNGSASIQTSTTSNATWSVESYGGNKYLVQAYEQKKYALYVDDANTNISIVETTSINENTNYYRVIVGTLTNGNFTEATTYGAGMVLAYQKGSEDYVFSTKETTRQGYVLKDAKLRIADDSFFGIDDCLNVGVINNPNKWKSGSFWVGIFLALTVGGTMFLLNVISQRTPKYVKKKPNPNGKQANQMGSTMKILNYVMILMMVFMSLQNNALAFYWVVGNIYSLGQTLLGRKLNEVRYYKLQKDSVDNLIL